MSIIQDTFLLNDGHKIPKLGFGTWQIPNGPVCFEASTAALKAGYRHIDSARGYDNEESVGEAMRKSGLKRDEIYLTTKLPADIKSYQEALDSFEYSMAQFGEGIDYVDLYLIHAPWSWSGPYVSNHEGNLEAWRAMVELQKAGRIKSIGVSNFSVEDLQNILDNSDVKPAVNQIRWFVGNTQDEITNFCKENDILVEAYSPLATGKLLEDPKIHEIAAKHGRTIPQIAIRYCLEKGVLPLPKSTHEEYIIANADLDFELTTDDLLFLDKLDYTDI